MKQILFLIVFVSLIITGCSRDYVNDKLIQAAEIGKLRSVHTALIFGADINAKNSTNGATALMTASLGGHTGVVKLLLEKGADVNVRRKYGGETALLLASWGGHTEIVRLLLDQGADANVKAMVDDSESTALKTAKDKGWKDIVGLLESAGAKE